MEKAIRISSIINAVLSSLIVTFLFIVGFGVLFQNADIITAMKSSFPFLFFDKNTVDEQNAIINLVGTNILIAAFRYAAGILFDILIFINAKPSSSKPICIVFGSVAILAGQLIPGILFIVYAVQKYNKVPQ